MTLASMLIVLGQTEETKPEKKKKKEAGQFLQNRQFAALMDIVSILVPLSTQTKPCCFISRTTPGRKHC